MNNEELYQRSDRVVYRTIGGERVLVPVTGTSMDLTRLYLLNDTAAAVWEHLAEPQTLDSLCAALSAEYGAAVDTIRADVSELLNDLRERRLIHSGARHG